MALSTKNRLLIYANDAASANVTLAYAYLYKNNYSEVVAFANNFAIQIYFENIPEYMSKENINFKYTDTIVTGTSGIDSYYELEIIKKAKDFGVNKIITIVDNISNFNMRFTLNDKIIDNKYAPDEIWIFKQGFKSNIDYLNKKFVYKDNIYYQFLNKKYKNSSPFIKNDFIKKYKNKYILLLTEYIYEMYGLKYGFTEYDILEIFLEVIDTCSIDIPIFLKLHPRENKNKFNIILRKYNHLNIIKIDCNIQALVYYSKIVFGIHSSVFIESLLFNKETFSLQINSLKNMEVTILPTTNILFKKTDLEKVLLKLKNI